MKILFLSALLFALPGGERERGLSLYEQGRYEEAAAAFRLAIAKEGDSAELQYNLALASWRAGDLATAETAVERYAALAKDARVDLHRGLLGAVRYDEAKQLEASADQAAATQEDPLPILQQALQKAEQARDHFVRGASETPSSELLRNAERALRYVEELKKKIEELEKQREEQEGDEPNQDQQKSEDQPEDDEQKESDPKDPEKGEGEQGEQEKGEPKPDEKQNEEGAEQPPEPQQQQTPNEQPKSGDQDPGKEEPQQSEPKPGENETPEPSGTEPQQPEPQPRNDAPGEAVEGRELSPEQTQRLLEQLHDLEGQLKALQNRAVSRRKPVERDW